MVNIVGSLNQSGLPPIIFTEQTLFDLEDLHRAIDGFLGLEVNPPATAISEKSEDYDPSTRKIETFQRNNLRKRQISTEDEKSPVLDLKSSESPSTKRAFTISMGADEKFTGPISRAFAERSPSFSIQKSVSAHKDTNPKTTAPDNKQMHVGWSDTDEQNLKKVFYSILPQGKAGYISKETYDKITKAYNRLSVKKRDRISIKNKLMQVQHFVYDTPRNHEWTAKKIHRLVQAYDSVFGQMRSNNITVQIVRNVMEKYNHDLPEDEKEGMVPIKEQLKKISDKRLLARINNLKK